MTAYTVYLSGQPQTINANATDTLATLRQKLAGDTSTYAFVYYNPFTKKKTILNDRSVEGAQTVGLTAFNGTTIIMTVVSGNKTDLFGTKADWLYDRHLGIRIVKNTADADAAATNQGKFDPVMLTDIQPSNSSSNVFYQRAVICEKDTVIQFNISSWGAAGYGYSIKSDKDTITDGLYITLGDSPNRQVNTGLRRYSSSNNSIQINSTQALNIPTQDVINYQKVTVKSWRVTSYDQGGKSYSSNTQAPVITSPHHMMPMAMPGPSFANFATAGSGGFDPGSPGGDTYVPGHDIQTGAPGRGKPSDQKFGSISNIKGDDPNTTVLGAVVFYFFVFKDHAAASQVINVLNAPNPNAFG